jgi:putative redox protein
MSTVQVKWVDAQRFLGVDSTKHSVVLSGADGENATGCKPSDLLMIALAGCTGVDVVEILKKQRQAFSSLEMNVTGEQDDKPPWTFRKIHIEFVLKGKDLNPTAVQRAVELAAEKYCSVGATLGEMVELTRTIRIEAD